VPFLEPTVHRRMHLYHAGDVMTSMPVMFSEHEVVWDVLKVLTSCSHNGFPVVRELSDGTHHFMGLILRSQLHLLLNRKLFVSSNYRHRSDSRLNLEQHSAQFLAAMKVPPRNLPMEQLSVRSQQALGSSYGLTSQECAQYLDMATVMNRAPFTVREDCPLPRVHQLFCAMGLRHVVVLDLSAQVVGIITRDNLKEATHSHSGYPDSSIVSPALPALDSLSPALISHDHKATTEWDIEDEEERMAENKIRSMWRQHSAEPFLPPSDGTTSPRHVQGTAAPDDAQSLLEDRESASADPQPRMTLGAEALRMSNSCVNNL